MSNWDKSINKLYIYRIKCNYEVETIIEKHPVDYPKGQKRIDIFRKKRNSAILQIYSTFQFHPLMGKYNLTKVKKTCMNLPDITYDWELILFGSDKFLFHISCLFTSNFN